MAWGFFESTGKSLSLGHGCWKFYNSSGELQSSAGGDVRWETLANGITGSPEVVFNLGDTITVEIFS